MSIDIEVPSSVKYEQIKRAVDHFNTSEEDKATAKGFLEMVKYGRRITTSWTKRINHLRLRLSLLGWPSSSLHPGVIRRYFWWLTIHQNLPRWRHWHKIFNLINWRSMQLAGEIPEQGQRHNWLRILTICSGNVGTESSKILSQATNKSKSTSWTCRMRMVCLVLW